MNGSRGSWRLAVVDQQQSVPNYTSNSEKRAARSEQQTCRRLRFASGAVINRRAPFTTTPPRSARGWSSSMHAFKQSRRGTWPLELQGGKVRLVLG